MKRGTSQNPETRHCTGEAGRAAHRGLQHTRRPLGPTDTQTGLGPAGPETQPQPPCPRRHKTQRRRTAQARWDTPPKCSRHTRRPLGPTDAQTGLGPCGPSDPAPTTLSLPPPPSHKHMPCTPHSAPTPSRRHAHLLSAPTKLSRHRPRHTDDHPCCPSAQKAFLHTNPLSE